MSEQTTVGLWEHYAEPQICAGPHSGNCPICTLLAEHRAKKLFSRDFLGPRLSAYLQSDLEELGGGVR